MILPNMISDPALCRRWDCSTMTIWRYDQKYSDFPKKHQHNRRNYRRTDEVITFEREHFGVDGDGNG